MQTLRTKVGKSDAKVGVMTDSLRNKDIWKEGTDGGRRKQGGGSRDPSTTRHLATKFLILNPVLIF